MSQNDKNERIWKINGLELELSGKYMPNRDQNREQRRKKRKKNFNTYNGGKNR